MTTRETNRYEVIKDVLAKKIDGTQAAMLLNRSVRQIQRMKEAIHRLGIKGAIHGNRGRPSHNKTDSETVENAKKHLRKTYYDFNPLLAQEHLRDDHHIELSKETVRQIMIREKLWTSKKKGSVKTKHRWRERKDAYGEMEQFDGSYHNWFEGRNAEGVGLEQCLLLSVDDATGSITGARFECNEGVEAVFRFWREYFKTNGLPIAIYLDKFSTYKVNHKNAVDNEELMTQFQRAMNQLDVRVINANSPQAKGRVEKMNGTLQRRLVKELRLNTIDTIEDANIYLKEVFIPKFNAQFTVVAEKDQNLHREPSAAKTLELDTILSIQSERTVCNDYTVRFKNNCYQLTETQSTTVFKRDKILIEEHLSGELKISLRSHHLDYVRLPERPKKIRDVKLTALTNRKQAHRIPPAQHPWRMRIAADVERKKYYESTRLQTTA